MKILKINKIIYEQGNTSNMITDLLIQGNP